VRETHPAPAPRSEDDVEGEPALPEVIDEEVDGRPTPPAKSEEAPEEVEAALLALVLVAVAPVAPAEPVAEVAVELRQDVSLPAWMVIEDEYAMDPEGVVSLRVTEVPAARLTIQV